MLRAQNQELVKENAILREDNSNLRTELDDLERSVRNV